jgi:hypothetical protein
MKAGERERERERETERETETERDRERKKYGKINSEIQRKREGGERKGN